LEEWKKKTDQKKWKSTKGRGTAPGKKSASGSGRRKRRKNTSKKNGDRGGQRPGQTEEKGSNLNEKRNSKKKKTGINGRWPTAYKSRSTQVKPSTFYKKPRFRLPKKEMKEREWKSGGERQKWPERRKVTPNWTHPGQIILERGSKLFTPRGTRKTKEFEIRGRENCTPSKEKSRGP